MKMLKKLKKNKIKQNEMEGTYQCHNKIKIQYQKHTQKNLVHICKETKWILEKTKTIFQTQYHDPITLKNSLQDS